MLSTLLSVLESAPVAGGGVRNVSMSPEAIDVLFDRLAGVYMGAWMRAIGDMPINDVKSAWAHELGAFSGSKEKMLPVAWALKNLPSNYPPNAVQFRQLCEQAPKPQGQAVAQDEGGRPASPEERKRLREAIAGAVAHLSPNAPPSSNTDWKAWAKHIIAAWYADVTGGFYAWHDGQHHRPSRYALALATQALGCASPEDAASSLGFVLPVAHDEVVAA
jgi:hypothetical protein